MIKRFLLSILPLFIAPISAMMGAQGVDSETPVPQSAWVSPVVFFGLDCYKLEQDLPDGSRVHDALIASKLKFGTEGKMVRNNENKVLPHEYPLESGAEYRIIAMSISAMDFVNDMIDKGKITIGKSMNMRDAYKSTIICNGIQIFMYHIHPIGDGEALTNISLSWFGRNSFRRSQTVRDTLLIVFYAANKKDDIGDMGDCFCKLADLAAILNICRGEEYVAQRRVPCAHRAPVPFYKGFMDFMFFVNAINPEQYRYALQFLDTVGRVRPVLMAPEVSIKGMNGSEIQELLMERLTLSEEEKEHVQKLVGGMNDAVSINEND